MDQKKTVPARPSTLKKTTSQPSPAQPVAPKTFADKKKENLLRLKHLYKVNLLEHKFALFLSMTSKKAMPIPGLLYIKGRGYMVGTYPDRGSAMKAQAFKKKYLTEAEQHSNVFSYDIYMIGDTIKSAAIREGLKR